MPPDQRPAHCPIPGPARNVAQKGIPVTKLLFNTEPRKTHSVRTGLEYRVDARTRNEPKRVWADVPTYKTWLGKRVDDDAHRQGYKAFKRENLSQAQQDEFYKLMDDCHQALRARAEADRKYDAALRALSDFGPVPPQFELLISEKVRTAIRHGRS
jgi:hypothetical protein